MTQVKTSRLVGWSYISNITNPYSPPEAATVRVSGVVYDHADIPNGERILTSEVVRALSGHEVTVITYSGSEYVLGPPMAGFSHREFLDTFSKVARARAASGNPLTLKV